MEYHALASARAIKQSQKLHMYRGAQQQYVKLVMGGEKGEMRWLMMFTCMV